jgi:RNA polymerase sigma-70 factor (ECF subfamily)
VRGGDDWAKEALYRRHLQPVWSLVLPLIGSTAEAEDIIQDAFIIAFGDIHKLREAKRFGAWLTRIAVHQVHRCFRRRKPWQSLGLTWGVEDASLDALLSADCSPEVAAEVTKIAQVLADMAPRNRIAWMLRFVEGCALDEVAERTGVSLATVKRRIAAADQRLKKHVNREGAPT